MYNQEWSLPLPKSAVGKYWKKQLHSQPLNDLKIISFWKKKQGKGIYMDWCSSKHQFWLQPRRWVWLLGVHPPLPVISCEFPVIIIHTQNPATLSY